MMSDERSWKLEAGSWKREAGSLRTSRFWFSAFVFLGACATLGQAGPATMPAAGMALEGHLQAMRNVKTLKADFVCRKDLAMLDNPLVSHGTVTISKPDS